MLTHYKQQDICVNTNNLNARARHAENMVEKEEKCRFYEVAEDLN